VAQHASTRGKAAAQTSHLYYRENRVGLWLDELGALKPWVGRLQHSVGAIPGVADDR
jgi:hypothetical protein